jgi:putative phage-type endonuclease
MSAVLVQHVQNSPEWHAWRKDGIGGSDAPVIEGVSPYRTPRQLFLEKSGREIDAEEDDSKEFIYAKGHKTEILIRAQFQERVGIEIVPVCFQHSQFDYLRASLDGYDSKLGVLEAKLVGQEVLKTALEKGEIPKHHFIQMQHQFAVSGADVGNWFGHDGKKNGALIEIVADKEVIKRLQDKEHRFWSDLKDGKMPNLTDMDYLIPEDQKLLNELRDAKELAENAKTQFEALRERAVMTYKHPKIAGAGLKIFHSVKQGSLDLSAIPEIQSAIETARTSLTPEYIESFRKKGSESWTVRFDNQKERTV